MSQVVSSQTYCIENSNNLTRPASKSFYEIDGSHVPVVIEKNLVNRKYHLQRIPNVNEQLTLDDSNVSYENGDYLENIIKKQIAESSNPIVPSVYHQPIDMSNESMAKFSFGKARLDPQRTIPTESSIVRTDPRALTILRHDKVKNSNQEIVPQYTDRLVPDGIVRSRIRASERYPSQSNLRRSTIDELARHFMYTSSQHAAAEDIGWDVKLPPKVPVPLTTYEEHGADPFFKSRSLPSFYDVRTRESLNWDHEQARKNFSSRKPFLNVAPLHRAQQISGYSGVIGGDNIQDIDNPSIDFKPYTIVRSESEKFSTRLNRTNIPWYTGKSHWTKSDPVSHYDKSGRGYTTTAAFHKTLPMDNSYRHAGVHGSLSRSVTTVSPYNPFNQLYDLRSSLNEFNN